MRTVREHLPTSVVVELQTSDQNLYGFTLNDVWLDEETRVSNEYPNTLDELREALWSI